LLIYATFCVVLFGDCFAEDKFVESLSPATPRESTEIDEEQEKHLLSPSDGTEDAHFVKEDASEISGVFEVRNNTGPSSV